VLIVKKLRFSDLSEEEKRSIPDNGCGKEEANYIKVQEDGNLLYLESDAMEPEDATFSRDLNWIVGAIRAAYQIGKSEGS
jgi:hypothetical protein